MTSQMIERAGCTVGETASGRQALEVLDRAESNPDMVPSDVVMPELDGVEFAEALAPRREEILTCVETVLA